MYLHARTKNERFGGRPCVGGKAGARTPVDCPAATMAQIPLSSTRLDSTRLDIFDASSPCILAVSS